MHPQTCDTAGIFSPIFFRLMLRVLQIGEIISHFFVSFGVKVYWIKTDIQSSAILLDRNIDLQLLVTVGRTNSLCYLGDIDSGKNFSWRLWMASYLINSFLTALFIDDINSPNCECWPCGEVPEVRSQKQSDQFRI